MTIAWVVALLSYLLGSVPTGYIAGRLLRGLDIRRVGDGNVGAANVFREIGGAAGIAVGLLDAAKGATAIFISQGLDAHRATMLLVGASVVAGHNWSLFLGFRGGRGEATTLGILLALAPQPLLIVSVPALTTLILTKNVVLTSAILFIPLPFVEWWMGLPGTLIAYSIALPCVVGITHFFRTRHVAAGQA